MPHRSETPEYLKKRSECAEKCLNEIQDVFEYRYRAMSNEQIKEHVVKCLSEYTNKLLEVKRGE